MIKNYLNSALRNFLRHKTFTFLNILGLTVGCITGNTRDEERQAAYAADITYGTNNEFGFDYLRDNMAHSPEDLVQRPHHFAIVDEVDSVIFNGKYLDRISLDQILADLEASIME